MRFFGDMYMDWIINSKIFKGSKYQSKVLAALADPVNKPLVQELTSYVDEEYIQPDVEPVSKLHEDFEAVDDREADSNAEGRDGALGNSKMSKPHIGKLPIRDIEEPNKAHEDVIDEEYIQLDVEPQGEESNEAVEECIQMASKSISASTYVDVETVSQAVTEIPGMLNLREDTAGVTYASLKGGATSELWVYYSSDVDMNKVLDKVNSALLDSGYYFLEFNRVSRDENAIIFNVNWISNYFNPRGLRGSEDAEN